MKKLLIIPILIFLYIFFIDVISQMNFQETTSTTYKSSNAEILNIGHTIGVSVKRPYFFGLIYLPVYTDNLGYIGMWHDAFFALVFILTIALILIEFKNRKEIKGRTTKSNKRS